MILPESRSLTWIEETAKNNNAKDITLVEKTIRAFSLLEALARSGMEFCFKGGSCLLLHLGSARRMSIDVDVICPPGTEIEKYLEKYSDEYGFSSVEPIERQYRTTFQRRMPNISIRLPIRPRHRMTRFCLTFFLRITSTSISKDCR